MKEVRGRMKIVHLVSVLIIICVFAVSSMILVNAGAIIYKNIVKNNLQSFELRTSLSYVKTKIHQYDAKDGIEVTEKDGRGRIVLRETVEGERFETVIYFYDGKLREITHAEGTPFKPEDGFVILNVNRFSISEEKGLIRLLASDKEGNEETLFVQMKSES